MYEKLTDLGLKLTNEQKNLLDNFCELFKENNSKVNLISKNDSEKLFEKHIYDSLAFNLFCSKYNLKDKISLLDIGTGGGFPSIPIALIYKNINTTAVDSINKKINCIKDIKAKLSIENLNPVCCRMEEADTSKKYDIVVSRAMAELRIILEYAIPFLKTGGYFIAYKSLKADEEIKNAQNALRTLNSKIVDILEYSLPIDEQNRRVLIVIKKEKATSLIYPRKNGIILKKPL